MVWKGLGDLLKAPTKGGRGRLRGEGDRIATCDTVHAVFAKSGVGQSWLTEL